MGSQSSQHLRHPIVEITQLPHPGVIELQVAGHGRFELAGEYPCHVVRKGNGVARRHRLGQRPGQPQVVGHMPQPLNMELPAIPQSQVPVEDDEAGFDHRSLTDRPVGCSAFHSRSIIYVVARGTITPEPFDRP